MDEVQKFRELKESIGQLSDKKIRLEERFKNEKEKLEALLKEIRAKGYDPQKLSEIKEAKEKELKESLDELARRVQETSEKLSAIEVQNA